MWSIGFKEPYGSMHMCLYIGPEVATEEPRLASLTEAPNSPKPETPKHSKLNFRFCGLDDAFATKRLQLVPRMTHLAVEDLGIRVYKGL